VVPESARSGAELVDLRRPRGERRRDRLVAELGTPEGVLHREAVPLTQHMVGDVERRAQGRAIVRGGRLDEDLAERGPLPDLPVGDAVHGAAAGQAELREPRPYI